MISHKTFTKTIASDRITIDEIAIKTTDSNFKFIYFNQFHVWMNGNSFSQILTSIHCKYKSNPINYSNQMFILITHQSLHNCFNTVQYQSIMQLLCWIWAALLTATFCSACWMLLSTLTIFVTFAVITAFVWFTLTVWRNFKRKKKYVSKLKVLAEWVTMFSINDLNSGLLTVSTATARHFAFLHFFLFIKI